VKTYKVPFPDLDPVMGKSLENDWLRDNGAKVTLCDKNPSVAVDPPTSAEPCRTQGFSSRDRVGLSR
jgi:hypothetical protein